MMKRELLKASFLVERRKTNGRVTEEAALCKAWYFSLYTGGSSVL
jgi:hypothetical protein